MSDDIFKNIYNKLVKHKIHKYYKFIMVIILYFLYQTNFILLLLDSFGLKINSIKKSVRMPIFMLNDLIYIIILIIMFKKEIKKGIKDLKHNFSKRVVLSLNCWIVGSLIMSISSLLISIFLKQNLSGNESAIRQSIQMAPIYMLFTCSIVAPIFEEMVFRRALYGLIKNKWIFIIASGVTFGLLHVIGTFNNITDFLYVIPYGAMGFAFAYLLNKTDNIVLPISVHMLHNTILVIAQIIGR